MYIYFFTAPSTPTPLTSAGLEGGLILDWQMADGLYNHFLIVVINTQRNISTSYNVTRELGKTRYNYTVTGLVGGVGHLVHIHSGTATEKSKAAVFNLVFTCESHIYIYILCIILLRVKMQFHC